MTDPIRDYELRADRAAQKMEAGREAGRRIEIRRGIEGGPAPKELK